jgi:hypothetical protein
MLFEYRPCDDRHGDADRQHEQAREDVLEKCGAAKKIRAPDGARQANDQDYPCHTSGEQKTHHRRKAAVVADLEEHAPNPPAPLVPPACANPKERRREDAHPRAAV